MHIFLPCKFGPYLSLNVVDHRKDELNIIGLFSLYLTNYLILRRLIKQHFFSFFNIPTQKQKKQPQTRHSVTSTAQRQPLTSLLLW